MYSKVRSSGAALAVMLLLRAAPAAQISRSSFEQLTDESESIVTGAVVRSWPAWDASHKHIWTHYELAVTAVHKGSRAATIEIAEPGGAIDGIGMSIAGTVTYEPGERVVVFAQRMPNGYLRTAGRGAGKYALNEHSAAAVADLTMRVAARVRTPQFAGGSR